MCSGWYGRKQGYAISISQHQWIVAIQRSSKCIQLLEWHIPATVSRILPLAKWSLCVALQKYFFFLSSPFPFYLLFIYYCLYNFTQFASITLCSGHSLSLPLLCPSYLHSVSVGFVPKNRRTAVCFQFIVIINSCNCLYRQKTEIPSMDPYN